MNPLNLFTNPFFPLVMSAIISAVVTSSIETLFTRRIAHRYEQELQKMREAHEISIEKLRAELTLKGEEIRERRARRLLVYPQLIGQIFKSRYLARDILSLFQDSRLAGKEEEATLESYAAQLNILHSDLSEQTLTSRFHLGPDQVFELMRKYKHDLGSFIFHLRKLESLRLTSTGMHREADESAIDSMRNSFQRMDGLCHQILHAAYRAYGGREIMEDAEEHFSS